MSKRIVSLWRNLFRGRAVEEMMDEELRSVVEMLAAEKLQTGMSAAEARRQALIELGGVEQVKEEVRASRPARMIEDIGRDLRYEFSMLVGKPGFSFTAILVLALGIGANTAIFSIVNAFLCHPLPVHAPEELVSSYASFESRQARKSILTPMTYSNYLAIRDQDEIFSGVTSFGLTRVTFLEGGQKETLQGQAVSGNFFDVLGIRLPIGRGFLREEGEHTNAQPA